MENEYTGSLKTISRCVDRDRDGCVDKGQWMNVCTDQWMDGYIIRLTELTYEMNPLTHNKCRIT